MVFPVVMYGMWELDCEESWAPKNWCFWPVVLRKTPESLDCKEIQPVHPKGDQPWVFIGRNDAKAETPALWPPHAKSWLIGKDCDAGMDWGQEEKETTEDEMAGWHHRLDGREFEWTPGVGDGQGGLKCCDSWGRKESDTTEWLNWLTEGEDRGGTPRTTPNAIGQKENRSHDHIRIQKSWLKGSAKFDRFCVCVCLIMSNSSWPHELWPTRLLCPWDFPGKNTGAGCHFLLQGIFLTQG